MCSLNILTTAILWESAWHIVVDMYCRNCGKILPNGSNYCPNCGIKQEETISKGTAWLKHLFSNHKRLSYVYIVWCLLNIGLLLFSSPNQSKYHSFQTEWGSTSHLVNRNCFYPFDRSLNDILQGKNYHCSLLENIDVYDSSELFFYIVLLPIAIFAIAKCYPYVLMLLRIIKKQFQKWQEMKGCEQDNNNTHQLSETEIKSEKEDVELPNSTIADNMTEGTIVETEDAEYINSTKEYIYVEMSLMHRLWSSIWDKAVVVVLFFITLCVIYGETSPEYTAFASVRVDVNNYEYIDRANIERNEKAWGGNPYIGQTKDVDERIALIFIFVMLAYYMVAEWWKGCSFARKYYGGVLIDHSGEIIHPIFVLLRGIIAGLILLGCIYYLHFYLTWNYFHVAIVFLLIMDIPVLLSHRSLLDLCTGVVCMESKEQEIQQDITVESKHIDASQHFSTETNVDVKACKEEQETNNTIEVNTAECPSKTSRTIIAIASICIISVVGIGLGILWYYQNQPESNPLCPELIEATKKINNSAPTEIIEGIIIAGADYTGNTFTLFCQIDDSQISHQQIDIFRKKHRENMLSNIRTSRGIDRRNYEKYVEYHVNKVDKFIVKETGENFSFELTPKEIAKALTERPSDVEHLKQIIDAQMEILPSKIDEGFVQERIEMDDKEVIIHISVDEDLYDFDQLKENQDELKTNIRNNLRYDKIFKRLCQLLAKAGYGLNIRCFGSQTHEDLIFEISSQEIQSLSK